MQTSLPSNPSSPLNGPFTEYAAAKTAKGATAGKVNEAANQQRPQNDNSHKWSLTKKLGVTSTVVVGLALLTGGALVATLVAAKRFGWELPGPLNTLKTKLPF